MKPFSGFADTMDIGKYLLARSSDTLYFNLILDVQDNYLTVLCYYGTLSFSSFYYAPGDWMEM